MNSSIFLDTTVFFHCIEHDRFVTILEHANNAGYKIQTSISVIGEAFTLMHKGRDAVRYITHLNQLLEDWRVAVHFPNEHVRVLCYQMGEEEIDTRMNPGTYGSYTSGICDGVSFGLFPDFG